MIGAIVDCFIPDIQGVASVLNKSNTKPIVTKFRQVTSEPLHNLKGHIVNLITELSRILPLPPGDVITQCNHSISCCLATEKNSGAAVRYSGVFGFENVGLWS